MRSLISATLALVTVVCLASPSYAVTKFNVTGQPGRSINYVVEGYQQPHFLTQLVVPGPVIYRSKAYGGTQIVAAKRYAYIVEPTTPGEGANQWRLDSVSPSVGCSRLRAGRRCNAYKDFWFVPNAHPFVNYHIRYRISWYEASTKRRIGRYFVDYNLAEDYHCNTPFPSCNTGYTPPGNTAYISFTLNP
jgi:hypothetical protein